MINWCENKVGWAFQRTPSNGSNHEESSYKWRYDVEDVGFKYHGNSIIASIGLVQLKYLEEDNVRRRDIAEIYTKLLQDVPEVKIIETAPDCISSRHLFQICVNRRDEIIQYFYRNDIYPGVHYIDNIQYAMYQYAEGTCPNARKMSDTLISLPVHLNLTDEEVTKVVDVLIEGITKYPKW